MDNPVYICDRCGKDCRYDPPLHNFVLYDALLELNKTYQLWHVKKLCWPCSKVANSFLNYYGVKREEDKAKLKSFLESGGLAILNFNRLYQSLMFGGYYE